MQPHKALQELHSNPLGTTRYTLIEEMQYSILRTSQYPSRNILESHYIGLKNTLVPQQHPSNHSEQSPSNILETALHTSL